MNSVDWTEAYRTAENSNCSGCPLHNTDQLSPNMPTSGEGKLGIMVIGEAAGENEAIEGTQFVGSSGKTLRAAISGLGYDLDRDFWKTNVVRCRPPAGKKPTKKEIKCCNPLLFNSIRKRKPKIVLALGTSALTGLIGKYITKIAISKFRGCIIPIPEHNFFLASTLHPSFVNRQWPPDNDFAYATMREDIKDAIRYAEYLPANLQVEPLEPQKHVRIVTDYLTFSALFEKLDKEKPLVAFDYETSSLKPQHPSRRIWSMSVCFKGISYSFPVYYPKVRGTYPQIPEDTHWGKDYLPLVREKIIKFLIDPKIRKIAHNESFERIWSHFGLGANVASLGWCSMTNQHILDSRKEFCGLKLQAFIRWGVHGYDDEVKKYLPSDSSGYMPNTLHDMPLEKLLLYGGIDSFLTEKLALEQMDVFNFGNNKPLIRAAELFHKTNISFTENQKTGIRIDKDYYIRVSEGLEQRVNRLTQEVNQSDAVTLFFNQEQRPFKMNSPKDLRTLLFDILGETSTKLTATGLDSVDKSVLSELKTPVAKKIIQIRELNKLKDTYIAQYLREESCGFVYPFFHTHTTRSGRSCIAKGSLILAARDFEKHPNGVPIEDIRKGDLVYCFDDNLNPAVKKVKWAGKTGHREVVRVHFIQFFYSLSGQRCRHGYLDLTPEHEVRLIDGRYVPAQDLVEGDILANSKHLSTVDKAEECYFESMERQEQPIDVYDIEVEDFHNFFANGICVHNSASLPNPQNAPKRNEKAKKLIRRGILPLPGHKMGEIDFSAIEVKVIGCATKDKTLLKYLWNPKSDMHYDQTKELFLLSDSEMNKALRYNGKSDFVFLEFYGGEASSSAKYLWHDSVDLKLGPNADGPTLLQHLRKKGIKTLYDFIDHVTVVEAAFWKKYTGVKAWQSNQCKYYLEHGYIETPFGFRRSGYLSKNAILNTRIQSTAAHFLWWCYNKIQDFIRKEKLKSRLLGQIHDSILPSIHPEEEDYLIRKINRVMTFEAPKEFEWVIVPIDIELELGDVDESWYDLKEVSADYYKNIKNPEESAALTQLLKGRVNRLYRQGLLL
ncbi:MAG: hypothetical protein EHM49_00485 [Deltaproteobacteria bacterium]|nr:MAG: hypothetical protein EHM49_00485 [Deltaproteobacteria bacterium]